MERRPAMIPLRCGARSAALPLAAATILTLQSPATGQEEEKKVENGLKARLEVFDPNAPQAKDTMGQALHVSRELEALYEDVLMRCITVLEANAGKPVVEMKPDYVAVRESIRQIGMLAGVCRRGPHTSRAAKALLHFLAEEFTPPVKIHPDWPPLPYRRARGARALTAAPKLPLTAEALAALGPPGARTIVEWIREGHLGGDLKPPPRGATRPYAPEVLADVFTSIFGDSKLVEEHLKGACHGPEDADNPVYGFYQYYRSWGGRQQRLIRQSWPQLEEWQRQRKKLDESSKPE
jgi:hypothetical protein